MKCPECKADDMLYGKVTLEVVAPLARGGGLKLGGVGITQDQIKEQWAKTLDEVGPLDVHGPITCLGCDSEFHYIVGETPALKPGRFYLSAPSADTEDAAEELPETGDEESSEQED